MSLTELLAQLVSINSVNPTLVAGAPGEREITNFVAAWLMSHGVTVTEVPSTQSNTDRPSLLCHVPGTGHAKSLLLYAHTDTVGVEGMNAPFVPHVAAGKLHGRGAYDMKASLAALMQVAAHLAAQPCAGDVWLMLAADEESDSTGTEAVLRELYRCGVQPAACIVTEPSDLRVMLGHRGFATGTIKTYGKAAHTARRDEGVDAIAMMARVLVALEDLDAQMQTYAPHALLGHGSLVASLVCGGSELFTYPAACEAQFVWRTLPGETKAMLTAQIERVFVSLKNRDRRFEAMLDWQLWREPMLTESTSAIACALTDAAQAVLGHAPEVCAAPWWTDAALIQAAGIPTIIFGPSGGGIHAVDEWVDLPSVEKLAQILLRITQNFFI